MQDYDPEGFAQRAPGSKKVIHRTPLSAIGPHEEWSMDGHNKLAAYGFEIYGIHNKWGGLWVHYHVLPSNRYAIVIGIVFLEAVKKTGRSMLYFFLIMELWWLTGDNSYSHSRDDWLWIRNLWRMCVSQCIAVGFHHCGYLFIVIDIALHWSVCARLAWGACSRVEISSHLSQYYSQM